MENQIKILLVEDEVLLAQLMIMQLEELGYGVSTVATGELAIISAKQDPPHIILMDIRLAGEIDGIEAAFAINSESSIPIIFITGYADPATRERAEKIKPLAYLIKPVNLFELNTIINDYFTKQYS